MLSAREKRITKTITASAYHLPSVGLEHKVVVDVVPRRAIVSVKALRRAVICDDHVVIDVVHLRGVARAAVLDVGDEGVPIPAVDRPARKPRANLSRATVPTDPTMRRKWSFGPCPWSPVSLKAADSAG